jgi:hypothetical protein
MQIMVNTRNASEIAWVLEYWQKQVFIIVQISLSNPSKVLSTTVQQITMKHVDLAHLFVVGVS